MRRLVNGAPPIPTRLRPSWPSSRAQGFKVSCGCGGGACGRGKAGGWVQDEAEGGEIRKAQRGRPPRRLTLKSENGKLCSQQIFHLTATISPDKIKRGPECKYLSINALRREFRTNRHACDEN